VVEVVEHLELTLQVEMVDLVVVEVLLLVLHIPDNLVDQVTHLLQTHLKEMMVDQEQLVLLLVVEVVVLPQLEGLLQHLQEVPEEQVLLTQLQVQMFHTLVVEVDHQVQPVLQLQVEQVEVEQVVRLLILLQLNQDQLIQVVVEVVLMMKLVEQVDQVLL
tara:strand:- start:113 stop:592 length:480 start_codon:yes stop_codon:yes gene_type:complete